MSPQNQERTLWWKVALHLDEAQLALTNAIALNTDDPTFIHGLQAMLRDGQSILYEIFRTKGLLPAAATPKPATPAASMPVPPPPPPPPMAAAPVAPPAPTVVQDAPPHVSELSSSNGSAPIEVLDYGEDAGKGFENQDASDEPAASPT
jgi:hypothetical protein